MFHIFFSVFLLFRLRDVIFCVSFS
jgi:hypothetical protein